MLTVATPDLLRRWADELELSRMCAGSIEFLEAVHDHEEALYPFSTRLVDGKLVNDFEHPQTLRYTITSLVGLAQALPAERVEPIVERFVARHLDRLDTPADLGLLSLLHPAPRERLRHAAAWTRSARLNMQDLGWMLWGASATGDEETARSLFERMTVEFVNGKTGLPRHTVSAYRRRIVSFGSLVYFLRSTYEYGKAFGDERALTLFRSGVRRALGLQGELGEWPWMIDNRSGRPFDRYPV